jgi:hypothetical protein
VLRIARVNPHLGLPKHPGRAGRTRPSDRRVHRLEDPPGRRPRPRPTTHRPNLATVPHRAGVPGRTTLSIQPCWRCRRSSRSWRRISSTSHLW